MEKRRQTDVYLCSAVPDGGILHYTLSPKGELTLRDTLPLPSPNYLVFDGDTAYATLSRPFPDSDLSGVIRLSVAPDGSLSRSGEMVPTGGRGACHLVALNGDLYVANYGSGSVTRIGGETVVHEGNGPDPIRQEAPHCHGVFFSPDKRYLLVCDLGLDTVFVYDRELSEISHAKVPDGAGCRHLVFSRDGRFVYVENEMGCSVSVFAYSDGRLFYRATCPTRTYASHDGPDKGSAIKLSQNGRRMYITNRGENEVVVLSCRGEKLRVIGRAPTGGDEPRDFALLGCERFGIVTNQFGNSFRLYRVRGLRKNRLIPLQTNPLPAAIAVTERPGK
ncbi:MAG: beta-propeller fold lactonase family protein [Clostridia bacterium]|nr:beta-propeller fold lactonase family protein [Clostridia bacterium]MBR5044723.1 beta-propeller fold lactonase family protein [Clostridia bacterium]